MSSICHLKMYEFKRLEPPYPWSRIESCRDHHVFKSQAWTEHLCRRLGLEIFIIEISQKGGVVGYFIGERFKRFYTVVGSPFDGWETPFQGCSFLIDITSKQRSGVYQELIPWILDRKYCDYLQISDWDLNVEQVIHTKLRFQLQPGYYIDLTQSQDEILGAMYKSTKGQIRKIFKPDFSAFTIEKVSDFDRFIKHHYRQLVDVFEKQGLTPTHSEQFLADSILDMAAQGKVVAYEVYVGSKSVASCYRYYDGRMGFAIAAASYREYQHLYLNEALYYTALMDLKEKGIEVFECGGGRTYKEKYGPRPYVRPRLFAARHSYIITLRNLAKWGYYKMWRWISLFRKKVHD